jgi:hypothetical protein
VLLKRLLMLFWTMYFSVLSLANLVELLGQLNVLDWTFLKSGYIDYMTSFVSVYGLGSEATTLLLTAAWMIQVAAAILFWRALLRLGRRVGGQAAAYAALCWGTFVWTAFVFMSELFTAYETEASFRELLMIMIATALAIAWIPDDMAERPDAVASET